MWRMSPEGDYTLAAGGLERTDPLSREVWFRLATPRGGWLGDLTLGSRIHELSGAGSAPAAALRLPALVKEALAPTLKARRLRDLTIETEAVNRSELRYRIRAVDNRGRPRVFEHFVKVI